MIIERQLRPKLLSGELSIDQAASSEEALA